MPWRKDVEVVHGKKRGKEGSRKREGSVCVQDECRVGRVLFALKILRWVEIGAPYEWRKAKLPRKVIEKIDSGCIWKPDKDVIATFLWRISSSLKSEYTLHKKLKLEFIDYSYVMMLPLQLEPCYHLNSVDEDMLFWNFFFFCHIMDKGKVHESYS